jgi:maleylpyruvate isomerase
MVKRLCKCSRVARTQNKKGFRLWIGGPVPPGSDGITLGRLVIVRKRVALGENFEHLLRHELAHVEQWNELGYVRYLVQYLRAYGAGRLRRLSHHEAYLQIPLEVEARARADRRYPNTAPVQVLDVQLAHERLVTFARTLSDADTRQASLLPGWTVGHVLAHLSLNAEALTRVAVATAMGETGHMYSSTAARAQDIDDLATHDAATLVARLVTSTTAFEAGWRAVTAASMATGLAKLVPDGSPFPIDTMLMRRLREVEVHSADCGHRRYTYESWSDSYVDRELSEQFNDIDGRTSQPVHLIDELGRHYTIGDATREPAVHITRRAMVAWMLSRHAVDGLPELAPWGASR